MQTEIHSSGEFDNFVTRSGCAMVYFGSPDCSVCKVLKPKIAELVEKRFARMRFASADLHELRELSAQNRIFTVPFVMVFFEGKELFRKSGNFSLSELEAEIDRPYSLLFNL